MITQWLARNWTLAVAAWLIPVSSLASDVEPGSDNLTAQGLLHWAIRSDLDGHPERRDSLLARALGRDPDFELARWQSGLMCCDGRWLDPDEVVRRAAGNPQLAAYRRMRGPMADTAVDHRELARWCRKNELPDEARVHWLKVFELAPGDREAVKSLRLCRYHNRILTTEQVEHEREIARARNRAKRYWQPKLGQWRRDIERGSTADRIAASQAVEAFDDALAVEVFERIFAVAGRSRTQVKLNLLFVETVARIPERAATEALVRRAVVADAPQVRCGAIYELKNRSAHTFVPQLIAAAPSSVTTRLQQYVSEVGGDVFAHRMLHEGNGARDSITLDVDARGPGAPILIGPAAALSNRAYLLAVRRGSLKERIQTVLEETTGMEDLDDPREWERKWYAYDGWDAPRYRVRTWRNRPLYSSCFPAGTRVPTLAGPMPIERVRTGDRVLAMDPHTGELAYKAVQRTTRRGMTPIVKIDLGPHALRASEGHPFWVVGRGWQVAKQVEPGDLLYALGGSATVESIDDAAPSAVFNLVVDGFHTYFVGQRRLLVHDNSPLRGGAALVPGLFAEHTSNKP